MSVAAQYAIALGVVFAVNLLPAFGPPTWAVLVFFSVDFDLPAATLVVGGALAAATGRPGPAAGDAGRAGDPPRRHKAARRRGPPGYSTLPPMNPDGAALEAFRER